MAAQDVPPAMPNRDYTANARAWIALIRAGVAVSAVRVLLDRTGSAAAACDAPDAHWLQAGASRPSLHVLRAAAELAPSDTA